MRTSEGRVDELHRRMESMRQRRSSRQYLLRCTAVCAVCLILALGIAYLVASNTVKTPEAEEGMLTASIFTDNKSLGYVVTAIIAFCLGTAFTVFCFLTRKQAEEKKQTTDKKQ